MAEMLSGFAVSQALYVVAKLDLAAKLLAGPRTPAELAKESDVLEDPLRRVLHTLSGVGVVTHREGDRFAVTDLGATLAGGTPGSLRGTALLWMETHYEAFGELLGTLRTGSTGFALRHGQEFVPYLREHPEHLPGLTSAMAELNGGPRQALLAGYRLPEGEVVADIGGADGSVLAALLADDPRRRGIVMDLPEVVPAATARMSEAGLAGRVSTVGGDFFTGVPSADVYLLSAVLHDWSDEDCVRLLGRIAEAARPGARLVVIESLLPLDDEPHPSKLSDLIMLTMAGGRERTGSEYTTLLGTAGFVVDRTVSAPAGGYSAIEATFEAG
ncbi:methyltransferase [Nocardiopsis ganjiahuensis]|uniref:methyltransferase n=1 Tax=Nocardiopsis ganjiahuensis TaxID=239984 RepID=UPI00034B3080|nr:methyltransferase [Nocardiopsis ganjiahuensis]